MSSTTSPQRTYRYLRMSIAGTVVVIASAVVVATARVGWLPSISAYYYTPARNAFVGALVASGGNLAALLAHIAPPAWLYGGIAVCALLYAVLFGLGAAMYRTLYLQPTAGSTP